MTLIDRIKPVVPLFLVLVFIGLSATVFIHLVPDPRIASVEPRFKDGEQNLTMAYNTAKYGVFSDSVLENPNPPPSNRREPLYPMVLAAFLSQTVQSNPITAQCLITADQACQPILKRLKGVNIGLLLAVSLTAFIAAKVIVGGKSAPLAAALWAGVNPYLFLALNDFYSDLFASLLFIILSTSLYLIVYRFARKGSVNRGAKGQRFSSTLNGLSNFPILKSFDVLPAPKGKSKGGHAKTDGKSKTVPQAAAILAGLTLGSLILVKAVFLYLGALIAIGFVGVARCVKSWQPIKQGLIVLCVAYLLVGGWMTRNFIELGQARVAGRDGEILAIRAEFSTMNWTEYAWSFCAFTPICKEDVLPKLDPQAAIHLHESKEGGFYRRTKDRIAAMRPKTLNPLATDQSNIDQQLSRDAIALIRKNWLKHVALTLTFAYRGMLPHFPYFIAFWVFIGVAVRSQNMGLLLFLIPSIYSFGVHSFASHYIDRYSVPLLPTLSVLLAPLFLGWYQSLKLRQRLSRLWPRRS